MDFRELKKLAIKHKNKHLNIAVIILALIIANNIYKQQNKEIDSLKNNNVAQTEKNKVLEGISKLEKKMNSYKNLLVEKDPNLNIDAIGGIAREAGVKIISIRPEQRQGYPDYIKAPFSLMISAPGYDALVKFINKAESHQIVYVVDYIDIRPMPKEELGVNLKLSSIISPD